VREERKEAFLGGGPVQSSPITVIIIIMSEFGGDEWVGIIRPKSFLITRDDKLQSLSALGCIIQPQQQQILLLIPFHHLS
jgi:hypothetical protein